PPITATIRLPEGRITRESSYPYSLIRPVWKPQPKICRASALETASSTWPPALLPGWASSGTDRACPSFQNCLGRQRDDDKNQLERCQVHRLHSGCRWVSAISCLRGARSFLHQRGEGIASPGCS